MPKPLIGLTASRMTTQEGVRRSFVSEAYYQAISNVGGLPVLIPIGLDETDLSDLLARLDGVLFTGGGDVLPARYGGEPHLKLGEIDMGRDDQELFLAGQVIAQGVPFLGICRGIQVINIALGGTLYEDLQDQMPGSLKHDYSPGWRRDYLAHPIEIIDHSRLASILNSTGLEVNSRHHQGLRQVASGVTVSAYAPDGLVEAVELPSHPFGLAVQWHPENLQDHLPMRSLFQAFISAAQKVSP